MPSVKPKKTAVAPAPAPDPLAALADELGALEAEIAPVKPKLARMEYLRTAIRDQYSALPATETFEVSGSRFAVLVGAKGLQQVVNAPKLMKAIGGRRFAALAQVTLKALSALPGALAFDCVTSAYTGPRSLKVLAKAV